MESNYSYTKTTHKSQSKKKETRHRRETVTIYTIGIMVTFELKGRNNGKRLWKLKHDR